MDDLKEKWKMSTESNLYNVEGSVSYHTYCKNLQTTLRRMLKCFKLRPRLDEGKKDLNRIQMVVTS